jgi:hypothetical protein
VSTVANAEQARAKSLIWKRLRAIQRNRCHLLEFARKENLEGQFFDLVGCFARVAAGANLANSLTDGTPGPAAKAQHQCVRGDGHDDDHRDDRRRKRHIVLRHTANQQEPETALRGEHLSNQHTQQA